MTMQNIGLMKALTAKMDYLDQRQNVLAQNVANADTPDYKARDLTEVDFSTVLQGVTRGNNLAPATTNAMHLPAPGQIAEAKNRATKPDYEVAPSDNGVVLEEQMVKSSRNIMDYNLMTSLYRKNVSMLRTALGSAQ